MGAMTAVSLPPFQRLFDDHAGSVLRWLASSVGQDEAEDCFQETMLAALRAYPRLRDASNLRGWLLTIARRKAVDVHRSRARRPAVIGDEVIETVGAHPAVAAGDEALWDEVRSLPAKQQRAVVMRYAGDRSYADIAGSMDISQDAARQNAHQGLKTLRRKLR
jgi:RNA polymerase sigma factor (sigma-70 family)